MLRFKTFTTNLLKIKPVRDLIFLSNRVSKCGSTRVSNRESNRESKRIETSQQDIYYECHCVPHSQCRNKLDCLSSR